MTYRVEVSAATINELSGKLAALASQLKGLPSVIELPTVEHTDVSVRIPEVEPSLYQAVMQAVREGDKVEPVETAASPEASHRVYDYNTEVAPRVLEMVSKCGRDAVKELLAKHNVTRASQLDPSHFPSLMDAVNAAMES